MPSFAVTEDNNVSASLVTGTVAGQPEFSAVLGVEFAGMSNQHVGTAAGFRGIFGTLFLRLDGSFTYVLDNSDRDTNSLVTGTTGTERFTFTYLAAGVARTGELLFDIAGVDEPGQARIGISSSLRFTQGGTLDRLVRLDSSALYAVVLDVAEGQEWTFVNDGSVVSRSTTHQSLGVGWDGSFFGRFDVVNNGLIDVLSSQNSAHGASLNGSFTNHGVVRVVADRPDTQHGSFAGDAQGPRGGQLFNHGLIDVVSVYGYATGVGPWAVNTGVIRVSAPGDPLFSSGQPSRNVFAVGGLGSGAYIENHGTIETIVTGVNSHSVAIYLYPNSSNVYTSGTIINTGRIIADTAVLATEGSNLALTITNAGYVEGDLNRQTGGLDVFTNTARATWIGDLQFGTGADFVRNAGTIRGDVLLSGGQDFFDGRGGWISGTVNGGAGRDVLVGGTRDDRLDGGSDDDLIEGGGGIDALTGGPGADVFVFNQASDSAPGSSDVISDFQTGVDRIDLSALAPTALTLTVSGNNTVIAGQAATGAFSITVNGTVTLADIVTSTAVLASSGSDILRASDGGAALFGLGGDDTLVGGMGNDYLDGGTGADTMYGGYGDDTYVIDSDGDRILEGRGEGIDTVRSLVGTTLQQWVENGILIGAGPLGMSGNDLDNRLEGNAWDNYLRGGEGDDVLVGLQGGDTLIGNGGSDRFVYLSANDSPTLNGDRLIAFQSGRDLIDFFGVGVVSYRIEARSSLWGSEYLAGMISDWNVVTIQTRSGEEMTLWIDGQVSLDDLSAIAPLFGSQNGDRLTGSRFADTVDGLEGPDTIDGRSAADTLSGGAGFDDLTGGLGDDTFRDTAANLNGDTIRDFSLGDRILIIDANPAGFSFTLTGNTLNYTGGSLTLSAPVSGALVVTAVDSGIQITISGPTDARNDFNGDGRSDILWRHTSGEFASWLGQSNGAFLHSGRAANPVDVSWRVAATGDFNGDGRDDIVWRHTGGSVAQWLGQADGSFINNGAGATFVDGSWSIVGGGDFNGDGRDDLIWRHSTGEFAQWLGQAAGGFVHSGRAANPVDITWTVVGTGDFNGDGRDDVLWRHSSGTLAQWLGQADASFVNNSAGSIHIDTASRVVGVGDFNGDGRDDVLFRDGSGALAPWLGQPNGSLLVNAAGTASLIPSWQIAGIGDYNGDGRDDLIWRHPAGGFAEWFGTQEGSFVYNGLAASEISSTWQIQSPGLFLV